MDANHASRRVVFQFTTTGTLDDETQVCKTLAFREA
jgi:hypothetical protein